MTMSNDWDVTGKGHPAGLLLVRDVKLRLKCSQAHVYALIEAGELECYKIGLGKQGGIRISEEQLQAYLDSKKQKGERPSRYRHLT